MNSVKVRLWFPFRWKDLCTGKIQEVPCRGNLLNRTIRPSCETQRLYFQHRTWSFDCIRNGNKRSSFAGKHGNLQLKLLQGHRQLSEAPLCLWHRELGTSQDGSLREHPMEVGVNATDTHQCHLCSTRGLGSTPPTAADTLTREWGRTHTNPKMQR